MQKGTGLLLLPVALLAGLAPACGSDAATASTGGKTFTREQLLDPTTCKQCHQQYFTEWSGSMHAYSSTDPVFRAMNARGQKETGGKLGDFCVQCHAPMAVREKATTDGLNLDSVPQALQGITCYFCHQVTDVTDTHNNPLVLANDTTMRGGVHDPVTNDAHHSLYSALHDSGQITQSSKMCGSCHDIDVPAHFSGASADVALERTFAEWKTSVFSDPKGLLPQSCGRCHFDTEQDVPIADPPGNATMPSRERHVHDLPAVDTALVAFPERDEQHTQVAKLLDESLRIEACATRTFDWVQVSLENLSLGHNFPSGASQDRRLWVELHAYRNGVEEQVATTPKGTLALGSGVVPLGTPVTDMEDTTWILRDLTFKTDGTTPAHMFWDIASINPDPNITPTIPVATPTSLNNIAAHVYYVYNSAGKVVVPDRVTVMVWLEPIGLDVLRDMSAAGYPVKGDGDGGALVPPRFSLLPNRGEPADAGVDPNVTLDWTAAQAADPSLGYAGVNSSMCLQTSQQPFAPRPAQ